MTNLEWLEEKIERNKTICDNLQVERQGVLTWQIIAKELIKLNETLSKIKQILKK